MGTADGDPNTETQNFDVGELADFVHARRRERRRTIVARILLVGAILAVIALMAALCFFGAAFDDRHGAAPRPPAAVTT